ADVIAVDGHLPRRRQLVADEEPDEGRLAGAGRSDEEREVSLVDREVDVLERRGAVGVALADVFQTDQIRRCPSSSASKRHVAVPPAWTVTGQAGDVQRVLVAISYWSPRGHSQLPLRGSP